MRVSNWESPTPLTSWPLPSVFSQLSTLSLSCHSTPKSYPSKTSLNKRRMKKLSWLFQFYLAITFYGLPEWSAMLSWVASFSVTLGLDAFMATSCNELFWGVSTCGDAWRFGFSTSTVLCDEWRSCLDLCV
jgi:hypothetical protein